MNEKSIMTLSLRLTGCWVLLSALAQMVDLVAFLSLSISSDAGSQLNRSVLISGGFGLLAYASFAAGLLLFAPTIASWGSPASDPSAPVATSRPVAVRDVYIIAARLLGIYSLLSAVPAVKRLAGSALDFLFHSWTQAESARSSLAEASSYLVGGALLIFFAAGIADVFSRAHGTPERPMAGRAERPIE